jgi:hypothetical protein
MSARSGWSKIFRGLSQLAEGAAELFDGEQLSYELTTGGGTAFNVGEGPAEASIGEGLAEALSDPDRLADYLSNLAAGVMGGEAGGDVTLAPGPDFVPPAEDPAPEAADPNALPAMHHGVPLQACPEMNRQLNEPARRKSFASEPANAMSAAAYYIQHCVTAPLRCEDWVRSVECLPGTPDERLALVERAGIPDLQAYAAYYDEAYTRLQEARVLAAELSAAGKEGDLCDADRVGRLLFWLGDRPDVNALSPAPEATAELEAAVGDGG